MKVEVNSKIVIDRPREHVASFAADPTNAPKWYTNIKSIEWKTPPRPLRVGSRVEFIAQFLGRRLIYTYEFITLDLPNRLTMRSTNGPFPMETSYIWEELGGGRTLMRLENRGNPTGFSSLVRPFLTLAMRHANRKDLTRLKTVMEGGN
jgi:hypothetical protein